MYNKPFSHFACHLEHIFFFTELDAVHSLIAFFTKDTCEAVLQFVLKKSIFFLEQTWYWGHD